MAISEILLLAVVWLNCSVHGLKYVAIGSSTVSRLCWLCIVVFQFTLAGALIYQVWDTWQQNPVVTITEMKPTSEVDFPAVTICPKGFATSLF